MRLIVPARAPATVARSRGATSVARGMRVGRVAQGAGLRRSRKLAQTACMCVGYRSPPRAVWASTVGSRFEKKMGRFVASEEGSDRQTRQTDRDRQTRQTDKTDRQTVLDFALNKTLL